MTSKKRSDALVQAAVRAAHVGLWEWNVRTNTVTFSAEWKQLLGYSESEIRDEFSEWERRVHPDDLPRMQQLLADYLAHPWPVYRAEFRMRHKDGGWRWILTQADLLRDKRGKPTHMIGSHVDITKEKQAAAELARSNRALRMLSDSNQALIRATDEAGLLREVCRIAVEVGGYRMAWVGFAEDTATRGVRPIVSAGFEEGYLAEAAIAWKEGLGDPGPVATAIRTGEPSVVREIAADPGFADRRQAAAQRGYSSAIALPLMVEGRAFGVVKIYSIEVDAFDAGEIAILTELAGDVAYGITALRSAARRAAAEAVLRRTEADLQLALEAGGLGDWNWNILTGEITWSERCKALYGMAPDTVVTYESFLAAVHPDDRARTAAGLERAVAALEDYESEKRVIWPDGSLHWNISRGRVLCDATGQPARMTGVTLDLTGQKRAEESIRNAERRLTTLMDSFPDFVSRFDTQGRFSYISPSVGRTTGTMPAAILGRTPLEVGVSGDRETNLRLQESIARVLAGGTAERLDLEFQTRDGPRPFEVRHIPETDDRGAVISVLGIATELTQRKSAERELYLLNFALNSMGEAIYLMEGDSPKFSYVNQGAVDALGYSREELTGGMGVFDIDPEWSPERWGQFIPEIRERRRMTIETVHRTRDGRIVPMEVTGNLFEYEGKTYDLAIARDVSQRRAAERALQSREREFRALAENTPDFIVRWDRDLNRVYINSAFVAAMGVPEGELRGGQFGTRYPPAATAAIGSALGAMGAKIRSVFATGEPVEMELPWHTVGGGRIFLTRLVPERDPSGTVTTVLGIGRDITALKETERQLRTLAEHSPDIIIRFDREGRYLYANNALETLTGVPAGEHIGRYLGEVTATAAHLAPAEVYRGLRQRITAAADAGTPFESEWRLPLADGDHIFNVRLIPEADDRGQVTSVLTVARDITERERAADALRASEQRFRQVTENIDEVFWLTDAAKTEMIYISPAYERVWGRPCTSVYAAPRSWLDAVLPEDQDRTMEAVYALQAEGGYDVEYRIRRPDGAVRWIHDRAFPIRDAEGRVYRIAGVAEDITVRRELEDQLRQAQKMEAIGQLAGGIAHDFNNMLAVIQMQSTLLLEASDTPAEARDGIREIFGATERAANLTRQLLTFSRRQVSKPVDLDIADTLGNMTRLLHRVLGETIILETRFGPSLPHLYADPGMMEQVLLNLAINARDAMPDGGRLAITLEALGVSDQRAALHPGAGAGRYVCLTVADTGSGIPAEALPRIFEPFFTTKEIGKGTGLGLATVFGIVEQHHGWIEVDSVVGKGTAFRVFLPSTFRSAGTGASALPAHAVPGGSETILLVEDEPAVRSITRAALERFGYRVLEADSAASAMGQWNLAGPSIHLLLTDLIMPGGISGRQLAETLLGQRPTLRVIFTTGYSPDVVNRMLHFDPGRTLLQKPYTTRELAACVRRILDEGT